MKNSSIKKLIEDINGSMNKRPKIKSNQGISFGKKYNIENRRNTTSEEIDKAMDDISKMVYEKFEEEGTIDNIKKSIGVAIVAALLDAEKSELKISFQTLLSHGKLAGLGININREIRLDVKSPKELIDRVNKIIGKD